MDVSLRMCPTTTVVRVGFWVWCEEVSLAVEGTDVFPER